MVQAIIAKAFAFSLPKFPLPRALPKLVWKLLRNGFIA
jgi:hypothetical protein